MPELLQIGTIADLSGFEALHDASTVFEGDATAMAAALDSVFIPAVEESGVAMQQMAAKTAEATSKIEIDLEEMKEKALEAGEVLKSGLAGGIGGIGAAIGIGVFTEIINHLKEEVLELGHLSEATGISIGKLTQLKDAMGAAGVETSRLPQQMTQLASAMEQAADGSQRQVDAFARLGIDTASWADKMPSELDLLNQIADHMKHSSDATADLAAARALFGRNVVGLTGFLKEGSEAIQEQEERFKEHGKAMEEAAASARALQAQEAMLKAELQTSLMPAFQGAVTFIALFEAGLYKVKAALEIVGRVIMAFGQIAKDQISGDLEALNAAIHGNFKRAGEISRDTAEQLKTDWKFASEDISKTWDTANAKADDLLKRMQEAKGATEEGGGPSAGGARKADRDAAQERLNIQRQLGIELAKLADDQGKYQAEVSGESAKLALVESQLAQSKTIDDKRAYVTQLATILEDQARTEKQSALDASTARFQVEEEFIHKSLALHQTASADDRKIREKLNGDLQLIEIKHQDEMVTIATTFEGKMSAAKQRIANENKKLAEETTAQEFKTAEQAIKSQETAIDGQVKAIQAGANREIAELANKAKLHQISATQQLAESQVINEKEYADAVELLKRKEQLFIQEAQLKAQSEGRSLTESEAMQLEGFQKIDNELLAQHDAFLKRKQQLDDQANQKFEQDIAATEKTFNGVYAAMVTNAHNFHEAVSNVWQSLGKNIESSIMHMLAAWITSMLEGKALSAQSALGQVAHSAAVAAAHAWAATAGIPIIGPVLAPVAAAAAFTGVMAFGGGIGSAEQGAVLPQDMMILAHRNEMILPPALSQGVQSMIAGGTAPGGPQSAPTHITYAPQIHAMDGPSVARVLHEHNDVLAHAVKTAAKGGRLSATDFAR